ncbi:hypothetical protein [Actinomyces oricola]|uniref:hypothetical protein n=1 Tax=Actinomyces oricola TaxID=206043 RepID=UPI001F503709|nr:hypothetical protein [Actinomyces oricola]
MANITSTTNATHPTSQQIAGLPAGGFRTILADPPWPAQSGERHYRTMNLVSRVVSV